MGLKSLNELHRLRELITGLRRRLLIRRGVMLGDRVSISLSSRILPGRPGSISIGDDTLIAFKTLLYTYDHVSGEDRPIRVGRHCFIGGGSVVTPGVSISDECIVAAGAVVTEDVPPRCVVGGVPARIIRRDIEVGRLGRLKGADANSREMFGRVRTVPRT